MGETETRIREIRVGKLSSKPGKAAVYRKVESKRTRIYKEAPHKL